MNGSGGIYILSGNSCDVWRKPFEAGEIRIQLHGNRSGHSSGRNGSCLCGVHIGNQISYGIH